MDFVYQIASDLLKAWRALSLSARINIFVAAAAVIAVILFSITFGVRPQYVTLSSGLRPEDTAKIADLLTQQNIPYRIGSDNTTVLVPVQRRSETQLILSERGLPVGRRIAPGFQELYAESELMTNKQAQDIKYMRAIQGELQQQLDAFDFVNYSLVLIREAKDELFISEQRPSEANVVLDINRPLTKREIKGIVSLVAGAGGPNLSPSHITVSTTQGDFLHLPPESPFAALAASKLETVVEWERQRESKIRERLRELGIRGSVSVSAKLNFDTKEVMSEEVSEGTELSTLTQEVSSSSKESLPEGAPGAFANVPEGTIGAGGGATEETTSEEIINYEPSRTVTKTKTEPGDVVKYQVAMVVEGDYEETTDEDGNAVRTYAGLPEPRREALIALAQAAVGEGEGATEVTIYDQPFGLSDLDEVIGAIGTMQTTRRYDDMLQWVWNGMQILMILGAFYLLRLFLRRAIAAPEAMVEEDRDIPITPEIMESLRRQRVSEDISRLANEDPALVAALIRSWMMEEES